MAAWSGCARTVSFALCTRIGRRACTGVQLPRHGVPALAVGPGRRARSGQGANALLDAGDVALSVQVLQEFYLQSTRESRADRISQEQATRLIESLLVFAVADIPTGVVLATMATRERFKISYWDAAIIEAARSLGCEVVLSEDLDDGQDYAGVRVENPFRA
jgi:predicted nucleic acid-binding protein